MGVRQTWTDHDEASDYVVPNVLSSRDIVSRPAIMEETVPHTLFSIETNGQELLATTLFPDSSLLRLCYSKTVA